MLPLYLYYKSRRQPLAPSLELLFQYGIVVSLNHVAAHGTALLLLKLTGTGFALDSARYTLVALFAAWLLFLVYAAAKYLKLEIKVFKVGEDHEKNERE